ITLMGGPPYDTIYMVGDATPNGWDITSATPLIQNQDNLFQFTWDGVLVPGDFKFPVNRNSDWNQDMFMKDPNDSSKIYLHKGGDPDDSKWTIYESGWYHIMLDLSAYTISYKPLELYMVGSATPAGWDIENAVKLEQDPDEPYIFTYNGPMVAGEFKFPVNRNSDWGQDMYMRTDDTHMYLHHGGASDDNKWNITTDGDYIITLNVKDLTIDIQMQ
ncbi:MAG TPA: SusF/SusE family outer membrane protein, partial [Bacteroidales bacterium]|nr:SusF/SusE family outer membrane protein [Bacteroidales bacterium]